jgi:hypothetical protein
MDMQVMPFTDRTGNSREVPFQGGKVQRPSGWLEGGSGGRLRVGEDRRAACAPPRPTTRLAPLLAGAEEAEARGMAAVLGVASAQASGGGKELVRVVLSALKEERR